MPPALRLQGITLTARDLEASERFYRWSFRLAPAQVPSEPGRGSAESDPAAHGKAAHAVACHGLIAMGWGAEDRLCLAEAVGEEGGGTLTFRMEATPLADVLAWCAAAGLRVVSVSAAPLDIETARGVVPGVPAHTLRNPAWSNLSLVIVEGWSGILLELLCPVPERQLAERGQEGPFTFRTAGTSGLEVPGLLGATWGGRDVGRGRELCEALGISPLEEVPAGATHMRVGDQQLILEEDERSGLRGVALVVPEGSMEEVRRTVEHLGAEFRQAGNRLVARDPDGRVVFVQGSRMG